MRGLGRSSRWVKVGPEVLLFEVAVASVHEECATSGSGCCVDALGLNEHDGVACAEATFGRERLSFGGPAVLRRVCLQDRSVRPDAEEGCAISIDVDDRGSASWSKARERIASYGGGEADLGYDGSDAKRRAFCRDVFVVLDGDDELRIRYDDPASSKPCGAQGPDACRCGGGATSEHSLKRHVIRIYGSRL